jgi:hypothetical protein
MSNPAPGHFPKGNFEMRNLNQTTSLLAISIGFDANPASGGAPTPAPAADKPKTVANDMPQRSIFPTPAEAEQFLQASAERYSDFADQALAAPALIVDAEGNATLDPAVYGAPGFETMVSLLRTKGAAGQVKAIVVAPVPTLELLAGVESFRSPKLDESGEPVVDESGNPVMDDEPEGVPFLRAIIRKELNHRSVRALREAEDVSTVIDQMPTTVEGYITSSRDVGGLLEPFNELYKQINATMSTAVPAWAKRRFIKQELRRAFESKGYAQDTYPEIEDAGKNGSLFEKALTIGINAAKRKGLGTEIFERWLDSRATRVFDPGTEIEDEELDLDKLTESMLTEPAAAPAEGEGAAQDGESTGENTDGEPAQGDNSDGATDGDTGEEQPAA